jgi:hypothetical protein
MAIRWQIRSASALEYREQVTCPSASGVFGRGPPSARRGVFAMACLLVLMCVQVTAARLRRRFERRPAGSGLPQRAALQQRMEEAVSGTLSVTFDVDPAGAVRRRTRVIRIRITRADGQTEGQISTETLERRLTSGTSPDRTPSPRPPDR